MKIDQQFRVVPTCLLAGSIAVLSGSVALAGDKAPHVLPPQAHAFGRTYAEWAMAHARWQFEAPADESPLLDGLECENGARRQQGHVWFLGGGGGGVTVRNCTVPHNKALFVVVSASFCSIFEGDGATAEELRACASSWEDLNTTVILEVDGAPVSNLEQYRLSTSPFDLTWPAENLFDFPAGSDLMVVDGTFLLLNPLKKGAHSIHRYVEASDGYTSDITWNLTVE